MPNDRIEQAQLRRVFGIFSILSRARFALKIPDIISQLQEFGFEPDDKGMNPRTIQRDIKFIREKMKYNIKTMPGGAGYLLTNRGLHGDELLPLFFEPEEIQALIMGRELFEPFEDTHLADAIETMYEKVTKVFAGGNSRAAVEDLEKIFHLHVVRRRLYKPQKAAIKEITNAMRERKKVSIEYVYGYQGGKVYSYTLRPQELLIYDNSLYLVAIRDDKKETGLKMYLVPRIKSARKLRESFRPVSLDKLDEKIGDAWGIFLEGKVTDVTITFEAGLANYLQEREWHKSQEFHQSENGIDMKLRIILNDEFVTWILGWGNKVLAVQPKELADRVKEAR